MSKEGLRVIAVASMKPETQADIPESITCCVLTLLGLVGLSDPPREGIKDNIATCNRAGIRVVMITGDNGITASSIARKIGMKDYDNIITGDMLSAMTDEELREKVFERWMTTCPSTRYMTEEIQRHFELGGHKAAAIGMVMEKCRVFLVSDLPQEFVSKIFFTPYATLDEACRAARELLGENASVTVMPFGGSTLPEVSAS